MKAIKFIKVITIILLLSSCTKKVEIKQIGEESFEVYQLEPGTGVRDIEKVGEYFFFADFYDRSIRKYDENFNFLSKFGRRGQGPEEFGNPCCIRTYDQKLFILDKSLATIKIFSIDGDFEDCVTLEKNNQPSFFCIVDSLIFVSSFDFVLKNIVNVYDFEGELLYGFAPKKKYKNYIETMVYNSAVISEEDTTINVCYEKRGLIEQYTKDGELIHKKEIKMPFKIHNISYADMRKFKNEVYMGTIVFQDVFFNGKENYAIVGGEHSPPDKQKKELAAVPQFPNKGPQYLMKFSNEGYEYYKLNSEKENLHFNYLTGDENYLYLLDIAGERVIKINTQVFE